MGFAGGLAALALAGALIFLLKAKNGVERPFARNWMPLVGVTMTVMVLLIGGLAALITNWH